MTLLNTVSALAVATEVCVHQQLACAGGEEVAPAAQQRLLKVCRQVITRAAEDTWQQTSQQAGMHQHGTDGSSWEQVIRRLVHLTVYTADVGCRS